MICGAQSLRGPDNRAGLSLSAEREGLPFDQSFGPIPITDVEPK